MSLRINTNIGAMSAYRSLDANNTNLSKSLEKLSSGLRINRASDDAAGLSISENLRSDITGLSMAQKNAQDGINMINTAEGGMNEVHAILQRMRELAVQSSNGTLNSTDRTNMNNEFVALRSEIDAITSNTKFNGLTLLDKANTFTLHVGAEANQLITLTTIRADSSSTGLTIVGNNITTQALAEVAMTALDSAIEAVSAGRTQLGAITNRLEHSINNLAVSKENIAAAESRIRDTDMAEEMANQTRQNILSQAAQSMLAQANQAPQSVLQLLR